MIGRVVVIAVIIKNIFSFLFSILLSIYIFPLLIKIAYKFNILDFPDGKIKKHKRPTPYLGSFGLFIPFVATLAIVYPFSNRILWLLLGSTLLFFVGLIDDLKVLTPLQKFAGQLFAVLCFLKGGISLKTEFFSNFINIFIAGFWMLSIINAFNLIDIMDGLVVTVSIFGSISFLIMALISKQYILSILILSFLGPLFVFFFYNKKPAKIYLGDSGSLFIGGFFAAITQLFSWSSLHQMAYFIPIILLTIPSLEIFFLVVIRTYKRIPFYKPSPDHFALYLRQKGWSVSKILVFISIISVVLLLISLLFLIQWISFFELKIIMIFFVSIWIKIIFI